MCCCREVCPSCWGVKGYYLWQTSTWWNIYGPNFYPSPRQVWHKCWRCNGTGSIPALHCCCAPIKIVHNVRIAGPVFGNAKRDIEKARSH